MAFLRSQKHYDDATLNTLVQTLRDVCEVLEAHEPDPEGGLDPALKKEAAFRLMVLVDSGIRDSQELRSRTLENFPLPRAH